MRYRFMLAAAIVGVGLSGAAQQPAKPLKVKPSSEFKVKDQSNEGKHAGSSAPVVRARGSASPRDLQGIERESAKGSASRSSKRVPAALLKPEKDRPNPKIDFKGSSGVKNAGLTNKGSNPYKGRLKQKGSHQ
jgi:hypothetical protein